MLKKIIVNFIYVLDAKKAFDKVWHDGLLLKFYERGIDLYIWKVLVSLHANLTSYVLLGDINLTSSTSSEDLVKEELFPLLGFCVSSTTYYIS